MKAKFPVEMELDLCVHLSAIVDQTHTFNPDTDACSTVTRGGTPPIITARCAECDAVDQPMKEFWHD